MNRRSIQRISGKRTYSIKDVSELCRVHPQTVRSWIAKGLQQLDDAHPTLVHGEALREFLRSWLQKRKRPCEPGQMYCCKCQQGRYPVLPIKLHFSNEKKVELSGQCRQCGSEMHRYGATKNLPALLSQFNVFGTGDTDLSLTEQTLVNTNNRQGDNHEED